MAQKKIEFNDKTNAAPVVDRDKQVVADDLNEIKDAVNSNAEEVDDINENKLEKPSSSSQNNIPTFENDNGNKLQDSGKSFEDSLSGNADKIPNSQIVKGIKDSADKNTANINTNSANINTNSANINTNSGRVDANYQLILSNGERISVNEYEIQLLKNNQVTGIIQKNTYADLVATTPVENVSFKVTNDSTASLNGYWHFEGTNPVQDAVLNTDIIIAFQNKNPSNWITSRNELTYNNVRAESILKAIKDIWFSYNTKPTWWDSRTPRIRNVNLIEYGDVAIRIYFATGSEDPDEEYTAVFYASDFGNYNGFSTIEKRFSIGGDNIDIHMSVNFEDFTDEGSATPNIVMDTTEGTSWQMLIQKKFDSYFGKINDLEASVNNKPNKEVTIIKDLERTNNLFDQEGSYQDGFIGDSEIFVSSSVFGGTKAIPVTPGETYGKYLQTHELYINGGLSSWSGANFRLFDDTGLLYSGNDTSILVPITAVNPRVYLSFYLDEESFTDLSSAMFINTTLFTYTYEPYYLVDIEDSGLYDYVKEEVINLPDLIVKDIQRTNNLFNQENSYQGGFVNDSELLQANAAFGGTKAISVTPGETYGKYLDGALDSWNSANFRLFDDTGLLYSGNDTSILVPITAVNPRVYLSFYLDEESFTDLSLAMFMNTALFTGFFEPYYLKTIDDETLEEFVKGVSVVLEQTTGTSTEKAISQVGVTNAIAAAVNNLSSLILETATGQSETNGMTQKAISDALADIEAALPGNPQYRFAERPASGYENFLVDVDVSIADNTNNGEPVQDASDIQQDRCILRLPTTYSRGGEPTRLVICGHGTGWVCTAATVTPWPGIDEDMLVNDGYAILGLNGTPGELDGNVEGHNAVPEVYRSILAAYKYTIQKYNIRRDGVLTSGLSMGGLMTMQMANYDDIPILAQVVLSAAPDLWKSQFTLKSATVRQRMCEKFGFEGTVPTFSSNNPPTAGEQTYILNNHDKWQGHNPLTNKLVNGKEIDTFSVWPASTELSNPTEALLYDDLGIIKSIPIKFFHCEDDTVASIRWITYYKAMLKKSGCYVEMRNYATGGHGAWYSGDDITFTTKTGVEMTVNGSSYESLLFLRRFDR